MALVFSLLTDAQLTFGFDPAVLGQRGEARPNGGFPAQVIVPRFSDPETRIDRKGSISLEFEWGPEESNALHRAAHPNSGCTVVLVSTRVLFSRGVAAHKFRRFLVEGNRLRSIASFPGSPLTGSPIPFSVLVFNDNTTDDEPSSIVFCKVEVDLHFTFPLGQLRTREGIFTGGPNILRALRNPNKVPWCRRVSRAQVAKEDYILAVDRYLDTGAQNALKKAGRGRNTVALTDIAEVIKAQSLRSASAPEVATVWEISPSEFPQFGYLKNALRRREIELGDLQRHAKQVIQDGDVLLATKGTIGRTAIALLKPDCCPIVASPSTVILRLKPNGPIREPVAVLMYLRSPLFQSLLGALVVGTTIPNVSLFDLRKLAIVVPTRDEQVHMRLAFDGQVSIQQQIDELKQQQAAMSHELWTALGLAEMEKRA
jgi:type I restriction enzyme M protein